MGHLFDVAGPDLGVTLLGRELLRHTERLTGIMECDFVFWEGGIKAKDWNGRLC